MYFLGLATRERFLSLWKTQFSRKFCAYNSKIDVCYSKINNPDKSTLNSLQIAHIIHLFGPVESLFTY